jgi:mannose-1-phosphate guanylyltransferase
MGEWIMKAVIMAGGTGTRLWPISREARPKQFQALLGDRSLLQQTYDRLRGLVPASEVFVCTVEAYTAATREQLPELPAENLIIEPAARNTGPAIGLVATCLHHRFGDTVVATVAADHLVQRPEAFTQALELAAAAVAERPAAVATVGIRPTRADTGYGYIRIGERLRAEERGEIYQVEQFVEKPDAERAELFVASGRYLWNASYFVWSTARMLALVDRHLPDVAEGLRRIGRALGTPGEAEVLQAAYESMPKVAIDNGVMERADEVLVVPAEMGWSDVGSWDRLHEVLSTAPDGVVARGPHVGIDDRNCLFFTSGRLVATLGLEDVVVVETEDAVLVCHKSRSEDLKRLMDRLRQAGKGHYLA